MIPSFQLPAQSLALLSPSDAFRAALPALDGPWIRLDGRIGNGLGNSGDQLALLDGGGVVIDALSWGSDTSVFDPPVPLAAPGTPLRRRLPHDTDTAADWQMTDAATAAPAPHNLSDASDRIEELGDATGHAETVTRAPERAAARPARGRLMLSEVAAGRAWIELYNAASDPLDPAGWLIDDDDSSTPPIVLRHVETVAGHGFVVVELPELRALQGTILRLLQPDGSIADELADSAIPDGTSWSRYPVHGGGWQAGTPPSPGKFNQAAPVPTATPRPSPTLAPAVTAVPYQHAAMQASGTTPGTPRTGIAPRSWASALP